MSFHQKLMILQGSCEFYWKRSESMMEKISGPHLRTDSPGECLQLDCEPPRAEVKGGSQYHPSVSLVEFQHHLFMFFNIFHGHELDSHLSFLDSPRWTHHPSRSCISSWSEPKSRERPQTKHMLILPFADCIWNEQTYDERPTF